MKSKQESMNYIIVFGGFLLGSILLASTFGIITGYEMAKDYMVDGIRLIAFACFYTFSIQPLAGIISGVIGGASGALLAHLCYRKKAAAFAVSLAGIGFCLFIFGLLLSWQFYREIYIPTLSELDLSKWHERD